MPEPQRVESPAPDPRLLPPAAPLAAPVLPQRVSNTQEAGAVMQTLGGWGEFNAEIVRGWQQWFACVHLPFVRRTAAPAECAAPKS